MNVSINLNLMSAFLFVLMIFSRIKWLTCTLTSMVKCLRKSECLFLAFAVITAFPEMRDALGDWGGRNVGAVVSPDNPSKKIAC